MSVEIEITRRGVYRGAEMLPVGTRLTLDKEPIGWVNKYVVCSRSEDKTMEVATPRRGRKSKRMSEEGATDGGDDNAY